MNNPFYTLKHQSDFDNANRLSDREYSKSAFKHHLARLEMMLAEERGEDLSYEQAIKMAG